MRQNHIFQKYRPIKSKGFTLTELLFVSILIGIITTLAIPSMRSIVRRHQDLDAASRLALVINQIKDQAIRRNKAYEITMGNMSRETPQGILNVVESSGNTCQSLIENVGNKVQISQYAFGRSEVDQIVHHNKASNVGLSGIRTGDDGNFSLQEYTFCVNAGGALYERTGQLYVELLGSRQVAIQLFVGERAKPQGPPRVVELTFSNGARLK